MMPMDVRDVREASPVTIETMSSSWVMEPCGKGGIALPTGVIAKGLGTCGTQRHLAGIYLKSYTAKKKKKKTDIRLHYFNVSQYRSLS